MKIEMTDEELLIMLKLKHGTLNRAWKAWCNSDIIELKTKCGQTFTQHDIVDISQSDLNGALGELAVTYVHRVGFNNEESEFLFNWKENENETNNSGR